MIIDILKEARKCIARLTPFPNTEGAGDEILLKAIEETADYADEVRNKITKLLKDLEGKEIIIK